jgi:hypothetical protein
LYNVYSSGLNELKNSSSVILGLILPFFCKLAKISGPVSPSKVNGPILPKGNSPLGVGLPKG